jgi:NitT/TauT family transport system permease protein
VSAAAKTHGPAAPRPGIGQTLLGALRSPWGLRIASLVVVFGAWEILGRSRPLFTSYPSAVLTAAVEIFVPQVIPAFASTLSGFTVGFAIAAVLGVLIGIAMGWVRVVEIALQPYVNAFYATPRVALIPLLILWLGIDFRLRVAIVVLSAVFPIIVNTFAGVKHADAELLDVGRAFTATRMQQLRTIVIPGCLPFVFTGLRIGLARALGGVVVAEMAAAVTGIGRLILDDAKFLRLDQMFVPLILLGVIAIALTSALVWIQRRTTPWLRVSEER